MSSGLYVRRIMESLIRLKNHRYANKNSSNE
jgi:hypothetical protein